MTGSAHSGEKIATSSLVIPRSAKKTFWGVEIRTSVPAASIVAWSAIVNRMTTARAYCDRGEDRGRTPNGPGGAGLVQGHLLRRRGRGGHRTGAGGRWGARAHGRR